MSSKKRVINIELSRSIVQIGPFEDDRATDEFLKKLRAETKEKFNVYTKYLIDPNDATAEYIDSEVKRFTEAGWRSETP